MKINGINIAAFGGLEDFSLTLGNGFTCVFGENENGKTTIMSFIRMMFFGCDQRSSSISKNPRKKYAPWSGKPMAGSINFEHSGRRYRIEREFRASNLTDIVILCDLDLGTRQSVPGDVGTRFFGLSAAAFERSVFIGQVDPSEKDASAEGELNSKLSNIVSTGDETTSYETVCKRLEKAKAALTTKRGVGDYDKSVKLIESLETELEKSEAEQLHYNSLKDEINRLGTEIAKEQEKADLLKAKVNSEQDIRNAAKLRELLSLKGQLDNLNESLRLSDGGLINEMFVGKLRFCISKIEGIEQKLSAKAANADELSKSIELATNPSEDISPEKVEELAAKIRALENTGNSLSDEISALEKKHSSLLSECETAENAKKPVNPLLLLGSIIAAVLTVILFVSGNTIPGAVAAAAGVALLISAFLLRPKDIKKLEEVQSRISEAEVSENKLKIRYNEISQSISTAKAQLQAVNAALNSSTAIIEHQKTLLNECNLTINSLNSELQSEQRVIFELFGHYRKAVSIEEIKKQLDELTETTDRQKDIKQQMNYIIKDIGNISYEEAEEKLKQISDSNNTAPEDFAGIKSEYEQLLLKITEKKTLLATLSAEAKGMLKNSADPDKIKQKLIALKEKTASQKQFCETADIAVAALTESFAELRRSYGSVLEKKAGEIFKGLTGEKYQGMSISKSFEISARKNGVFGGKELDYLSSGTADQAYLSLRLALSELISETSEPLPVMLDDALTQYDDSRAKSALEFLKGYSETEQVILFTCHSSVLAASKDVGADCTSL